MPTSTMTIISAALSWLRLVVVSRLVGSGITLHLAFCGAVFAVAVWALAAVGLWHSFELGQEKIQ